MVAEIRICDAGGRGMFFPLVPSEHLWSDGLRGMLYATALVYLFLGVSVVADKFVSAIEVITSKKRRVKDKTTGRLMTVEVWNGTVANLTLLALGSSAPEILLSIVETVSSGFHSGALGPGTIVGSAAFNLFVIIAVCIMAIPSPEIRQIKEQSVFVVTAIFSLFAYVWMVVIVQVISPDVVEIWEAVVTLGLLPVLLAVSYAADIGAWPFDVRQREKALATKYEDAEQPEPLEQQQQWPPVADGSWVEGGQQQGSTSPENDAPVVEDEWVHAIGGPAGVLSFAEDVCEVSAGFEPRWVTFPFYRYSGVEGAVACRFRTEAASATPGFDYIEVEGELQFAPGEDKADIHVELLPKRLGEHSDRFRIIVEDAVGGAVFNPNNDGGAERCILTVTILNLHDALVQQSPALRISRCCDALFNVDSFRRAMSDWKTDINNAIFEVAGEEESDQPTRLQWIFHIISLPWKFCFAVFVPPASMMGGWACFFLSLGQIGLLTAVVIDFAELFGCVAGIEDSITAITLVALGTSMPDLFASHAAAKMDQWADASIVNVTGSNSVNVFVGIGIPWLMASIYWAAQGATDDWKARYGSIVGDRFQGGGFVVQGGDMSFSVLVFTLAALVALAVIHFRRKKLGGELGGPLGMKILSSLLLVLLWFFYIALSVWKVVFKSADLWNHVVAIFVAVVVLENVMLVAGVVVYVVIGRRTKLSMSQGHESYEFPPMPPPAACPPSLHFPVTEQHTALNTFQASPTFQAPPTATYQDPFYGHTAQISTHSGPPPQFRTVDSTTAGRSISFTGAAMVCLAANRFKQSAYRRRQALGAEDLRPLASTLPRGNSFYSVDSALANTHSMNPGGTNTVGGRVANWVANHAGDCVVLGVSAVAAAQLANRHMN